MAKKRLRAAATASRPKRIKNFASENDGRHRENNESLPVTDSKSLLAKIKK